MSKLSYFKERLKLQNSIIVKTILMISLVVISGPISLGQIAQADEYDAKINELRQKNSEVADDQSSLNVKEESLTKRITALRKNISEVEGQIRSNKSKRAGIAKEIERLEAEIAAQRVTLGVNVKQMYLDDQMTMIEKMASSRDLSEYVDKAQYRVSVQDKVQDSMQRIDTLKQDQETQKTKVEKLLKDQEGMQTKLAADRKESERLLKLNKKQQSEYAGEMRENNAKIAQLQREQAAENARHFVSQTTSASAPSGGGSAEASGTGRGYPWAGVYFPNSMPDPWGMYKRQCVSYTAWRVANSGRHMPYWGGRGNAKLWDDNARAAGIPVDTNPRVGDVAVSNAGTYGHVMYVEAVHGDGTISISDYNAGWDGRYREGRRTTAGLVFIHF